MNILFLINKSEYNKRNIIDKIMMKTDIKYKVMCSGCITGLGNEKVISTRTDVLRKMANGSLSEFAGSKINFNNNEFLFIRSIQAEEYNSLNNRYIMKFVNPHIFVVNKKQTTVEFYDKAFDWSKYEKNLMYIAMQVKAKKRLSQITFISYTFVKADETTKTIVVSFNSDTYDTIKNINESRFPKAFYRANQNISLLTYWELPLNKYFFDIEILVNIYSSDIHESLQSASLYMVRNCKSWKGERDIESIALDSYYIANILLYFTSRGDKQLWNRYELILSRDKRMILSSIMGIKMKDKNNPRFTLRNGRLHYSLSTGKIEHAKSHIFDEKGRGVSPKIGFPLKRLTNDELALLVPDKGYEFFTVIVSSGVEEAKVVDDVICGLSLGTNSICRINLNLLYSVRNEEDFVASMKEIKTKITIKKGLHK